MRFLTIGDPEDLTLAYAARIAAEQDLEPLMLSEEGFGVEWRPVMRTEGCGVETAAEGFIPGPALGPALVRFSPSPAQPAGVAGDALDGHLFARERRSGIHRFLFSLRWPVCNRPFAGGANMSKPLQMGMLARSGFDVPPWITTNDPVAAGNFAAETGECVVKATSGMRAQVSTFGPAHEAALEAGTSPVLLQARVRGANVRVHVFGDACFATEVNAPDVLDYRFEEATPDWQAREVPDEIRHLCRAHAAAEGLLLGGLDFLVEGEMWWCLECNPAPTFITYEAAAGQPICRTLIAHLAATGSEMQAA